MKYFLNLSLLFIVVFLVLFPVYINFQLSDLNSPSMFQDEICSYNGSPNTNLVDYPNNITCICQDEYTNDIYLNQFINGVPVQCSYEKRRRFITLFLSIFLPFGADYLYLGRYLVFFVIFFTCWFTLIGNCYRFAVSDHTKYFQNNLNRLFIALAIILLVWWILNITLIWTGIIKDAYGVDTVNDLSFLINLNTKNS